MKKSIILFFLIYFFLLFSRAEKINLDSLEKRLSIKQADTARINLFRNLCYGYQTIDSVKSKEYCAQSLKLSEKIHFVEGIIKTKNVLASIFENRYDYTSALGEEIN